MILALFSNQVSIADVVVLMVAGLLGIPALRSRRKDESIKELQTVATSNREYIGALERDKEVLLKDRDEQADKRREAENKASGCQAAYEELSRYAAPEALRTVHAQLAKLEGAMVTALSSQGELVMKNTEVLTDIRGDLREVLNRRNE